MLKSLNGRLVRFTRKADPFSMFDGVRSLSVSRYEFIVVGVAPGLNGRCRVALKAFDYTGASWNCLTHYFNLSDCIDNILAPLHIRWMAKAMCFMCRLSYLTIF